MPIEFLHTLAIVGEKLAATIVAHALLRATEIAFDAKDDSALEPLVTRFHRARHDWLMPALLENLPPEVSERLLSIPFRDRQQYFPIASLLDSDGNGSGHAPTVTLSPTLSSRPDGHPIHSEFVAYLRRRGIVIVDDPVFRLLDVSANNTLSFGLTSYERVLSQCDRYYYSLMRVLPEKATRFRQTLFLRRRLTKKWISTLTSLICDRSLETSSSGVGCSCLFVLNVAEPRQPDRYEYFIVAQSSQKNGVHERHVVPSFMFQPTCRTPDDFHRELDLPLQVLREFGEELLGETFKNSLGVDSFRADVLRPAASKALSLRLLDGRAELHVTGVWLDLFRLRPEITCLLLVRDREFFRDHSEHLHCNFEAHQFKRVFLADNRGYHTLLCDPSQRLCAPGAAALVQGRALAMTLTARPAGTRVPPAAGAI